MITSTPTSVFGKPSRVGDGAGGGAGTQDIDNTVQHALDQLGGNRFCLDGFAGRRGRLLVLYQTSPVGDLQIAIQPGGDRPVAVSLLVQVDHFGFVQAGLFALQKSGGQFASQRRVGGKDRRVDLDAGRDAQHRDGFADRVVNIAGSAIAAGEQDQVNREGQHFLREADGVGRAGRAGRKRAYNQRRETGLAGDGLAHLARRGEQLQVCRA